MTTWRLLGLMLAGLLAGSPALATDMTYVGPVSIPGSGTIGKVQPFPISFDMSGVGTVTDVNLTFTGFSHSYSDDLAIVLVSPENTAILVMNNAGGSANWVNATLTFDQQATDTINNFAILYGGTNGTIPGGSYKPSTYAPAPVLDFLTDGNDLDLLNGENGSGIWRLYMLDTRVEDKGSFASVTLSINSTPAVPEPASWALMIGGFALAGAALRHRSRHAFA